MLAFVVVAAAFVVIAVCTYFGAKGFFWS